MKQKTLVSILLGILCVPALAGAQPSHGPHPDRPALQARLASRVAIAQGRRPAQERGELTETERTTRKLRLGDSGELHVSNISGDIAIKRGSGGDATVEIVKTARSRSSVEDAKELLKLVVVDVTERNNRAEIKTRYPEGDEMRRNNRRNINVNVTFTITAPAGTRVQASSVSGDVSAAGIEGEVWLETISGTVRIDRSGRAVSAKSISGDVTVTDTDLAGRLEASSTSGSVSLQRIKAQAIDANSISGNVVMADVACVRADAQTISGDVDFSGPLLKGGRYELTSHSGNVTLTVAGGVGFEVEATTFSGSLRSELPLDGAGAEGARRRNRTLRGVHGDGSAVLDITTFSGDVVISKR